MSDESAAAPPALKPRTSPWTDGKRRWNERYGDGYAQARNWRLIALVLGAAWVLRAGGDAYHAFYGVETVPYVVEKDRHGDAIPIGRAEAMASAQDPRTIHDKLTNWIRDVRSVYADRQAQSEALERAAAATDGAGPAWPKIQEFYDKHDPWRGVSKGETVIVHNPYARPKGGDVWLVGWTEEARNPGEGKDTMQEWEAEVVVKIDPPRNDDGIAKNAAGDYVEDIRTWGLH